MTGLRAAVIGLGRMGSTFDDEIPHGGSVFLPYCHGPAYFHSPKVELIAGADLHYGQRKLFGERWQIPSDNMYSDYREMLAKEDLDIVSVCTSARVRSTIVQDLARAGVKAIWAEKPIALSLEEADTMVRVCDEEGVALAINCARRWNPLYTQVKRVIDEGQIGKVLQVTANAPCDLSHNGSHLLDTVRFLAGGDVQWVMGEMESDEAAEADDDLAGNGYLAFDNGARAFIRSMPTGAAQWNFDILGEEGMIRSVGDTNELELTALSETEFPVFSDSPIRPPRPGKNHPVRYPFPWPTSIQGMGLTIIDDLVNSIETGTPPKCSGADGLLALETAIALRESHRRGFTRVDLPLKDRGLKILSAEIQGDDVPRRVLRESQSAK